MDEDTHLCLLCQQLVVGLNNYVNHRSRSCLPSAPPVVQSCWSQDAGHPSEPGDPLMSAPDFFLSLELKSAEPRPTTISSFGQDRETDSEQSDDDLCQAQGYKQWKTGSRLLTQCTSPPGGHMGGKWKPGYGQDHFEDELYQPVPSKTGHDFAEDEVTPRLYSQMSRQNVAEETDCTAQRTLSGQRQDLSEDDLYPPRSHTSGKWKPGTRPELTNEVWLVRSSSPITAALDVVVPNYIDVQRTRDNGSSDELISPREESVTVNIPQSKLLQTSNHVSLTCSRCEITFHNESELGIHMFSSEHICLSHDGGEWLQEVLDFQSAFVTHLPFQCSVCHYYFLEEEIFCSHFVHHNHFTLGNKHLLCLNCCKVCSSTCNLLTHFKSPVHKMAFKKDHPIVISRVAIRIYCSFCNGKCCLQPRTFYSSSHKPCSLVHQACGTDDDVTDTHQDKKTTKFFNGKKLVSQRRLHKVSKSYSCSKCTFQSTTTTRLKRHSAIHLKHRPRTFLCESCGLSFHDRNGLLQHAKRHTEKSHKCLHCEMTFHTNAEMTDHCSRLHSDLRPHLCHVCGYSSKSRHQLLRHQRRLHSSVRRACPYSGCRFLATLSSDMSRHLRTHTGKKPYKCPYCKYETGFMENLRCHILKTKKHKGKNVYPCKMCKFKTNDFAEYNSHVKGTHSHIEDNE